MKKALKKVKQRVNRIKKCCGYPNLKKAQAEYCPFCHSDLSWLHGYREGRDDANEVKKV